MTLEDPMPNSVTGGAIEVQKLSWRPGFMAVEITVPDDFDRMGIAEIEQLFGGEG